VSGGQTSARGANAYVLWRCPTLTLLWPLPAQRSQLTCKLRSSLAARSERDHAMCKVSSETHKTSTRLRKSPEKSHALLTLEDSGKMDRACRSLSVENVAKLTARLIFSLSDWPYGGPRIFHTTTAPQLHHNHTVSHVEFLHD